MHASSDAIHTVILALHVLYCGHLRDLSMGKKPCSSPHGMMRSIPALEPYDGHLARDRTEAKTLTPRWASGVTG